VSGERILVPTLNEAGKIPSSMVEGGGVGAEAGTGLVSEGLKLSVKYGTAAATSAQGNDARITGALAKSELTLVKLAELQPFPVELPDSAANGSAKHDGKLLTNAEITTGTKILKSTSKSFVSTDVGKYLAVNSAGEQAKVEGVVPGSKIQNNTLCSRIAAFINSEEVELETAASNTVTGALCVYATDDTEAIQKAINKAVALAQSTGIGYCEVWFSHAIYGTAGELKTGGTTLGNAQITLPVIECTSSGTAAQGQKITLVLKGSSESSALPLWYQKVPQQAGAMLFSFGPRAAGETKLASKHSQPAYSITNGRPAVIGGPTEEQGFKNLKYSNMMVVVQGLTMSAPSNSSLSGITLGGVAQASIPSFGSFALGIPSYVEEHYSEGVNEFVLPWAGFEGEFSAHKRPAVALEMPARGNNDNSLLGTHCVEGHTCAVEIGEHGWHSKMVSVYCLMGMTFSREGFLHPSAIGYMSVEACPFGIYAPTVTKEVFLKIDMFDTERAISGSRWITVQEIYDPESKIVGECGYFSFNSTFAAPPKISGARLLAIKSINYGPGRLLSNGITQPAVPANKGTLYNLYYRDALVTIKTAAASAVKVTVDGVVEFKGNPVSGEPKVTAVALPNPVPAKMSLGALVKSAVLKGTDVEGIEVESYNSGTKELTLKSNCTGSGTGIALVAIEQPQYEIPESGVLTIPVPAGMAITLQYAGSAPTWDWTLQ
jgi:hypothetical protein